jgi:hypothetical protein
MALAIRATEVATTRRREDNLPVPFKGKPLSPLNYRLLEFLGDAL